MNMSANKSVHAFREGSNNSNNNNSNNNNSKNERRFSEHSHSNQHGDVIRGNFVIPPPSRKYTTTNPGTLSPIYHLVYDLTAPTTVTTTTNTKCTDTHSAPSGLTIDPSIPANPNSNFPSPATRTLSEAFPIEDHSRATNNINERQERDGFSQSSHPQSLALHASNDRRRSKNRKDFRNVDTASVSHRNKTSTNGPTAAQTGDDIQTDGTLTAFFSHSKQADGRNFIQERQGHGQLHLDSSSGGLGKSGEDGAPAISGLHQTSTNQSHSRENGLLSNSGLPKDAFDFKLPHSSHTRNNVNSSVNGKGYNNSSLITRDEDLGTVSDIPQQQALSVRQAIDVWSERSKGQEGITNESNSHASYQQGGLDPNAKRAVFKRDGDCVRLLLLNKDNDNSKSTTRNEDNLSNGFIPGIGHSSNSEEGFKREHKLNTSKRLLNKLGLFGLRGSNSKGKSRNKKDNESTKANPISANHTTKSKEKIETDAKPPISKKPLNRWDSIHVHTKQALASAANPGEQINQTIDVSQNDTDGRVSDHSKPGQGLDMTGRLMSDSMTTGLVTHHDSATSGPVIKGILVTKGKAYDTGPDNRNGQQSKQNCVQFADNNSTDTSLSSHAKLFPPQFSSSVLSSSLHSSPHREIIDRNKYIIKNRSPNTSFDQPPGNAMPIGSGTALLGAGSGVADGHFTGTVPVTDSDQSLRHGLISSLIHDNNRIAQGKPSPYPRHSRTEESREAKTSSDEGHFSSGPGGGSQSKHAGGLVQKFHSYNPPHGVGQDQSVNHKIKESIPGALVTRFDKNGYYPEQNSITNNNIFETDEASLDSNGEPKSRYQRHSLVDQSTLSTGRERGQGFINHSGIHPGDTVTASVEWSNKQVDGEETLRYRRTLREIGKKNRNLLPVDQSNQKIKQRLGDFNFNAGFVNGGVSTSGQGGLFLGPTGVGIKPKPNLKPKITPRQKFEITHSRLSGKVASNLRHNYDHDKPLHPPSTTAPHQVSKIITNPSGLATPMYKESPRAKFERDRAARSNNNNNNSNNNGTTNNKNFNNVINPALETSHEFSLNDFCPKRLNKSCDDLETDSDGYLKPSTACRSHSTETLLLSPSFTSDSQTPLSLLSKLSPRARFENSRQTGIQPESQKLTPCPEMFMKSYNSQSVKSQEGLLSTVNDLGHRSLLKPVQEPFDSSSYYGQRTNFSNLASQLGFPSAEQRKPYLNESVRSDQSTGKENNNEHGMGWGGEGQYGTSEGERFLTEPRTTHLPASSIDTGVGWSGPDDEVGISQVSDERQARHLFKSQAEWSKHSEENGSYDKPVPVNIDIQAVQGTARFHEGNFKFSSTNFATSAKAFVISNQSDPLSVSGGRIEEAKSATYINVSHGTTSLAEAPRPSQVAAVKKMSPDSVSSSGYESEHASSAIFQKNLKNNNHNIRSNNGGDHVKHDNSFASETGFSTVQELKLRFGHNQQTSFDARNNQHNNYVPQSGWRRRFNDNNNIVINNNNNNNKNSDHDVLLSDDRYDESLAPRNHNDTRRLSNQTNSTSVPTDVNNNNKSQGLNSTESDTGIRYDHTTESFRDNNKSATVNKNNLGVEHGFSDSQLFSSSRNRFVKFEGDQFLSAKHRISPTDRKNPKEKKHTKLEKVSRSMHEIIHDLKLESGESQVPKRNRNRRSRRCSKCQDNSSPNFCPHCQHQLDYSRDSIDSGGVSSQNLRTISVGEFIQSANSTKDNVILCDTSRYLETKQNRVSHSVSEVAAMLASKGLRIYEDTGEYVPMKNSVKSPTLTSLKGNHFNLEAASYLIVPTVVESFTSNSSKTLHSSISHNDSGSSPSENNEAIATKTQRQIAVDVFAQRSISDSGASARRTTFSLAHDDDDINNGAHSDGELCDDAYLSMDLSGGRPRAMSMDVLCSDGAVPDAEDSTDAESSSALPQKVVTRLRRRRSSKGYVEWRTCSGWVGKTDMRLAEGRNSRGYIEWDTIWTTATPWKGDGTEDEHVYDVIEDESASQTQGENETDTQTTTADNSTPGAIDMPPALPERTYINRLKNVSSAAQTSKRHSPHHHHSHHHHHHHHHHHGSHHHHHQHGQRHQHQSHSHSGGRRSHGHHHRSSPQSSSATPKLKSANKKPPPPAPPVQTTKESPPDPQNYAVVSKLKGYTFSDALTSPSSIAIQPSTDKSVIYSENYWHLGPTTSEERLTSWQSGDVLDYIDGLHDSMSPKRRENIYILLNNKKTRAKFSESLEIESRLLSKGLLCNPNSPKDGDPDSKPENMDTSTSTPTAATTHDHNTSPGSAGQRSQKVRTSVSSTYV